MDRRSPFCHFFRLVAQILIVSLVSQSISGVAYAASASPRLAIAGFRSAKNPNDEKIRKALLSQIYASGLRVADQATVNAKLKNYTSPRIDPKLETSLNSAYERYNAGIQFYGKLDLTNALREFDASVKGYREGISMLQDNHYLLFSHLYLGITLNFLGREEQGKKYIQEMVRLDAQRKTRQLPIRDFPPKIVDLHRQVTQQVLSSPLGSLTVDSKPLGAKVYFDGTEVGRTPLQMKDIPAGQHYIGLELGGYQFQGAAVQVAPKNQTVSYELKEKKLFETYSNDELTSAGKEELGQVADLLQSEILVLGQSSSVDENRLEVKTQLYHPQSGELSEVFRETVDVRKFKFQTTPKKIKEVVRAWTEEKNITGSGNVYEDSPRSGEQFSEFREPKPRNRSSSGPIYKKWWFWTIAGAVVLGGGAGAYLLLKKDEAESNTITFTNPLNQ